ALGGRAGGQGGDGWLGGPASLGCHGVRGRGGRVLAGGRGGGRSSGHCVRWSHVVRHGSSSEGSWSWVAGVLVGGAGPPGALNRVSARCWCYPPTGPWGAATRRPAAS